ncbi:MAG: Fe-S cluster assembly protein SufD [Chloroflexi bacterium]|jgi:Fe-S cluster assembly protein SufD|nr:Fe-S cluster assembly protein SufD [Chloroflexota bacterium]MBT3668936.1 Fe-S cluster assembly protein SufD [Chloroflexota bacterium]MBT4002890.1 Fe-S cluster assembly protein SufD [Chloroflexota bacterium]MBT4305337.1 Fe-S cluster assembly protein SufD [Chloroflexota bacterium]MBT4532483.1 Fe-S cluster assembly protein SufD [Chloroflexota bacterium]
MATKKRVVTRRKSSSSGSKGKFNFNNEMIPVMANGQPEAAFLTEFRKNAFETFEKLELPKKTEEPWRRTDIRRLATDSFSVYEKDSKSAAVPEELLAPLAGEKHGGQITLTPAGAEVYLDQKIIDKGVIFTDFKSAAIKHPELLEKILGKIVKYDEDKFSAMTASFAESGVLLYVPKGVEVETPLHSVLWGPGEGKAFFSHLLVFLEEQASVTYVHEYASPDEAAQSMHSGIVEIHVGKAANLRFVELQSWGNHLWNFSHERANVERDGRLDWIFGAVGTKLTKNFTEINLVGEGSEGRMSGFYFTDREQHLDHDTQQNHMAPHTTSDLLFKGALKDNSRSVWQGMIYVAPGAQQTDGYQSNPNLVLSDDARADSIPGLEILADDVRCTHGATIGKIDEEEVFYLGARGIPREEAKRIIIEGFFDPIMQRIPFEKVRTRLQQAIVDKLD